MSHLRGRQHQLVAHHSNGQGGRPRGLTWEWETFPQYEA